MQSALTTAGNSVASRLQQCSLKQRTDEEQQLAAISPGSRRRESLERPPKKKLTETEKATIRVIAQYLQDLGLSETVQTLSKESRCKVENTHAARLRAAITEMNWDDAVAIIDSCYDHLEDDVIEKVRNILKEEKFFDLVRKQKRPLALHMLKTEFDARNPMRDALMRLLFETDEYIFSRKDYSKYRPNANGTRNTERICARIQRVLPPSFMLPTNRLKTLLEQAYETQVARCETHIHHGVEADAETAMLFSEHKCPKRVEQYFVETCLREDHKSEVWKVEFSPCGKFLASASFATVVYFWKVNSHTLQLEHYRKITARDTTHGVSGMSWSADSRLLAVCGADDHPYGMYIYDMHGDKLYSQIAHDSAHSFTCIHFFPTTLRDKHYHLTVGDLRGSIQFLELSRGHTKSIEKYEGFRIRSVYSCKSGRGAYAADTHNRIRWYRHTYKDGARRSDHTVIREDSTITGMSMHPSEQLMLITTRKLGLRMWNVQTRTLLRTFQGYHDGGCVINACFGGVNSEYIVAGSYSNNEYDDEGNLVKKVVQNDCTEEETIRIWRLTDEYAVCGIVGHRSTVNSVSWNPRDPFMIASGSDDNTIRLWSSSFTTCRQRPRLSEGRTTKKSKRSRSAPVPIPKVANDEEEDDVIDETPLSDLADGEDEDIDVTGSTSDDEGSDDSDSDDSEDETTSDEGSDSDDDDDDDGSTGDDEAVEEEEPNPYEDVARPRRARRASVDERQLWAETPQQHAERELRMAAEQDHQVWGAVPEPDDEDEEGEGDEEEEEEEVEVYEEGRWYEAGEGQEEEEGEEDEEEEGEAEAPGPANFPPPGF